jgi:hypothetical protein
MPFSIVSNKSVCSIGIEKMTFEREPAKNEPIELQDSKALYESSLVLSSTLLSSLTPQDWRDEKQKLPSEGPQTSSSYLDFPDIFSAPKQMRKESDLSAVSRSPTDAELRLSPQASESKRETSDSKESRQESSDLIRERRALLEKAEIAFGAGSENYIRFGEDMMKFEERARMGNLAPSEITETYKQTERLLSPSKVAVSYENRKTLAQNLMFHAARPEDIDQGQYDTCNVTAVQERLFTSNPSKVAEIISSTAINGNWRSPDGNLVKIDAQSLLPMPESRVHPPADGDRSYATQLINNVLVNDVNQRLIPPIFYRQVHTNIDGSSLTGTDVGERLCFADGRECLRDSMGKVVSENGVPIRSPYLDTGDLEDLYQRISGDRENVVIANSSEYSDPRVTTFRNEEDFEETLMMMKAEGRFPLTMMVDSNSPAFGGSGSDAGWHVVTITDYDFQTGKAHISNQWGAEADRDISVKDLFRCSLDHSREEKIETTDDRPVP